MVRHIIVKAEGMSAILKFRDFIERILLAIAAALLCLMAILIAFQIFVRTIGIGIDWTEEFARFSFVCATFLGSVVAITKNRHIYIDFLVVLLPNYIRRPLMVGIYISMAAFMILCSFGVVAIMVAARGVPSNSVAWFHLNHLYAIIFIGCILMIFSSVIQAIEYAFLKKELPPAQGT